MRDHIDCRVASGETLRFGLFKEGRPLSPMGGNYLYVREDAGAQMVIFAGQTDNLSLHAQERWTEAVAARGVNGLYTRLNITTAVRRREHQSILEAMDPPMNAGEPGAASRPSGEDGEVARRA